MTIIVEDGTGVSDANSYLTLAEAVTLAENMGIPTADMTEDDVIKGMGEVHKYGNRFKGSRTNSTQSVLADFPRTNCSRYGTTLDNDAIPSECKQAQVAAAVSIHNGTTSFGVNAGKVTTGEEVVGAVKVSYADSSSKSNSQTIEQTYSLLRPLMTSGIKVSR